MRPKNARIVVLPAPKRLKPGGDAAKREGCTCTLRGTGFHTREWWALAEGGCPYGHTQADLDALGRHWKDGEAT